MYHCMYACLVYNTAVAIYKMLLVVENLHLQDTQLNYIDLPKLLSGES